MHTNDGENFALHFFWLSECHGSLIFVSWFLRISNHAKCVKTQLMSIFKKQFFFCRCFSRKKPTIPLMTKAAAPTTAETAAAAGLGWSLLLFSSRGRNEGRKRKRREPGWFIKSQVSFVSPLSLLVSEIEKGSSNNFCTGRWVKKGSFPFECNRKMLFFGWTNYILRM